MFTFFNYLNQKAYLTLTKSNTSGKFNFGLNPEFCFTVRSNNMYMHSFFFAGEKEKPEIILSENGWTHLSNI